VLVDALILAGGRSSRLNGVPKARLRYRDRTLLEQTLAAVSTKATAHPVAVRSIVVVGDVADSSLPPDVLVTREEPQYSGPAAGIAAGLTALGPANPIPSDYTLVLACDMPGIDAAVAPLLSALLAQPGDGVIAVDGQNRLQPLAAAYGTAQLTAAAEAHRATGILEGLSTFQLIAGLALTNVTVPQGATDDVDTWADAERFGVARPPGITQPMQRHPAQNQPPQSREKKMGNPESNQSMSREEEDVLLKQWSARLVEALAVQGLDVDLKGVLGLAGRAAHSVLRPAAPLTTFVVGYAAGLAVGAGQATSDAAVKSALDVGFQLCRDEMIATNPDHGKQ
jgi:molybdopterin-guanine dinucleotide biosynthesis protein A